jgi:transcriptional regulator with XRE-family HTH domain
MAFGKNMRLLRELKCIGLNELAVKVGVSNTYISLVEKEKQAPPSIEIVEKIAHALGVDSDVMTLQAGRIPKWMSSLLLMETDACLKAMYEIKESKDGQR